MSARTLFITTDVPRDGGSGGQIASWRALQAHAALASVDLLVLAPGGQRPSPELLELVDRCELVDVDAFHFAKAKRRLATTFLRAQIGRVPYRVRKFADPQMRQLVDAWAAERRYTMVHCDHVSNWQYARRVPGARRLLLHHNIEWQTYETLARIRRPPVRWAVMREARRSAQYELGAVSAADRTLVLSEGDRQWLIERLDERAAQRVSVWPLPVKPLPLLPAPMSRRLLMLGSLRSIGRLQGSRWLLREVWPALRQRVPDAQLDVVGADPPSDIRLLNGTDGITVQGFVENLEPVLSRAEACLIPLFVGGGVRVKVFELLSRGIPCIGTPLAVQGIDHLPGVLAVHTLPEWLDAAERALSAKGSLREQAAAGGRLLAETHTLDEAVEHLARIVRFSPQPPIG